MNRRIALAVLATLFTACDREDAPLSPSPPQTVSVIGPGGTTYSGRAIALDVSVLTVHQTICDTGPLPSSGGNIKQSFASASIPGVLTTKSLYCETSGVNNLAHSEAGVFELILTVGGNNIFADLLSSMAGAKCTGSKPSNSGTSQVTRLFINGQGIAVRGTPNQTVPLPGGGSVIINEQSGSVNQFSASKTVTALHVIIPPLTNIIIARTHADIDCQ